jgi:redox-sensitive bicupin YhaK (pirin superfamily)
MSPAAHSSVSERRVERLVTGRETSDGDGVRLTRILTSDLHGRLDPFLMLDLFGSDHPGDYLGGFPDHPHRGFETVTYMIEGRMRHRDSAGNQGLLVSGGAQWMTAGSGLVHSEMPEQEEGRMEGFQLWINLPARDKMSPPHYRDLAPGSIPEFVHEGVRTRVLAGSSHGTDGAISRPVTAPLFLDLHMPPGSRFEEQLAGSRSAFVVPYRGTVRISGTDVPSRTLAVLGDGELAVLEASEETRAILVAGVPLREPIAAYGPFVMNTAEEIRQAFADYRDGKFEGMVHRD